jgi:cytochrome c553
MKIILSVILALFLVACSDSKDSKTQSKELVKTAKNMDVTVVTKDVTPKEKIAVKQSAPKVEEVVQKVQKTVVATVKPVEKKVKEVAAVATTTVAETKVDGAKIFMACSSCHGLHAEKQALGKSQVIQGWKVSKIEDALKGYKAGTYGSTMKGVMKGQVSKLSDAEIKAVATYISKL